MKVLTFSLQFPKGHPKQGEPTFFVEKIWKQLGKAGINIDDWVERYVATMKCDLGSWYEAISKHHTIRYGSRWNVGDMASLRVWSGRPYCSKQIEFAQVEVKKVWPVTIIIDEVFNPIYTGEKLLPTCVVAKNDGLECDDFANWFKVHSKRAGSTIRGQIICWSDKIEY